MNAPAMTDDQWIAHFREPEHAGEAARLMHILAVVCHSKGATYQDFLKLSGQCWTKADDAWKAMQRKARANGN